MVFSQCSRLAARHQTPGKSPSFRIAPFAALCLMIGTFSPPVLGQGEALIRVSARILERPADYPFDSGENRVYATNEIDRVFVGQDFVVQILVEDIRPVGTQDGVFALYADINFDEPSVASLVPGLPMVVHPQTEEPTPYLHNTTQFGAGALPASGDGLIDTDSDSFLDQIDALGSYVNSFDPTGSGEFVLVEWAMHAESPGVLNIRPESTSENPLLDPDDDGQSPANYALMFGVNDPVCPAYGASSGCVGTIDYIADSIAVLEYPYDIDDSGAGDALTDGLLLLRYLFGFRGAALIEGAVSPSCNRCTAPDIEAFLEGLLQ